MGTLFGRLNLMPFLNALAPSGDEIKYGFRLDIVTVRGCAPTDMIATDVLRMTQLPLSIPGCILEALAGRFAMTLPAHIRFCGSFLVAVLLLACQPAFEKKRVALVIGNSNYKNAALLPTPANDAAAIAATLKGAGFDVVDSRLDLQSTDMRR